MPRLVISDTSPVRYLVLMGSVDLLPALYGEVLIPETVAAELQHPHTPGPVRRWMANPPAWLQIMSLAGLPALTLTADLDPGEYDAIRLALDRQADLMLIDERHGVEEARRLCLTVTGTLGILDQAAARHLIRLDEAFARLRETNFRIDPTLLDRLLQADAKRRDR